MTARARVPTPPKDLSAISRDRWKTVLPALMERGSVDLDTLRAYCELWARWRKVLNDLDKAGDIVKTPTGRFTPSPLVSVARDYGAQVRSLAGQIGLHDDPPATSADRGSAAAVPDGLTRRELAAKFNVHMSAVTKWERAGMPLAYRGRKGKPSRYREADVRAWLDQREAKAAESSNPNHVDVVVERARKERAQAVLAEQTYAARQRQLLPAEDVERAWAAEVQAVRTSILATYTTQADRIHRIATLEGVGGVEAVLKELAHELLRELSAPGRALPDEGEHAA